MPIQIIPIRADFLLKVRNAGLDDQNQPVEHIIAKGGEPCRDVLRAAHPGEPLILASYCPFSQTGPYKEYGPIFVLADESKEPVDLASIPLPIATETDYLGETFVLRAYSKEERIVNAVLVTSDTCHAVLSQLLHEQGVAFVLLRYAAFGCYAMKIQLQAD